MEQTFTPTSTAPVTASLPFQAQSVRIDSGGFWVSIPAYNIIVPPYVTGFTRHLSHTTNLANFFLTAQPTSITPLGPALQTVLTFSDAILPDNPGVVGASQTIATFHATQQTAYLFNTGLARSASFVASTGGAGNPISWAISGMLSTADPNPVSIGTITGVGTIVAGFGQTYDPVVFSTAGIPYSFSIPHIFPTIQVQRTSGTDLFTIDGRLYF